MRAPILTLAARRASRGQHPGLLLQRYLCADATGPHGDPEERTQLLNAACRAADDADLRALYRVAFDRWRLAWPLLTETNEVRTEAHARLVVGLGSESVLETGLRLHHTYGLPVLPGSALKGLAAHYCATVWGEADARFGPGGDFHHLLFGTTDESGCIAFHDGWLSPDSTQALRADVMTPHHLGWLDGSAAPTDYDSPTPVPFLSVAGTFRIAVSWVGPAEDPRAATWTECAFDLLARALADWGIGGKTTSGYGRLVEPEPAKRRRPALTAELGLPSTGSEVEATLLAAPKKDKPWRAEIPLRDGSRLAGPIDGQGPATAQPGQRVRLRVLAVAQRSIQFAWLPTRK